MLSLSLSIFHWESGANVHSSSSFIPFFSYLYSRASLHTYTVNRKRASAGREPVVSPRPFKLPFLFHFSSVLLLSVDIPMIDTRIDASPIPAPFSHPAINPAMSRTISTQRDGAAVRDMHFPRENCKSGSLVREIPVIPGRQVVFFNANHRARCGGCRIRVSPTNTRL